MTRRFAAVLVAGAALAGCGPEEVPPVPAACTGEPAGIVRALGAAPRAVELPGGGRLSACVGNARSDAALQNVGLVMSRAAEDLELRAVDDPRAALELGYLIGAARRGARRSSGIQDELVRRLERSGALDGSAAVDAAIAEGLAAGEATG